jgi:hypothetical protein
MIYRLNNNQIVEELGQTEDAPPIRSDVYANDRCWVVLRVEGQNIFVQRRTDRDIDADTRAASDAAQLAQEDPA